MATKTKTAAADKGGKDAAPAAEKDQAKEQATAQPQAAEAAAKEAAEKEAAEKEAAAKAAAAKESTSQGDVQVEVSTRQQRRIRAGVVVTRKAQRIGVTEEQAAALEADRHIKVKRL